MTEPPAAGPSADALGALLSRTRYKPVRFLGTGGMGEVWVIEHRFLRKEFVLKLLHAHLGELAARMRVEVEAMGHLQHENVVDVIDSWVTPDGRPCVVLELLEGRTLWDEIADRLSLPAEEAIDLALQALSALGAAHALGIVHRDIKPQNLFLHHSRGYGRILKVLDFGLARVLPGTNTVAPLSRSSRTRTGTVVGTPIFMSPEAVRGEPIDHRGDLYSLGMVLYVMLAGHAPFEEGSVGPAPPSRYAGSRVSPELDAVVLRAVREKVDERYQTADEFSAALKPFLTPSRPGGPLL
jgi:serine/threonine protein kinase